MDIKPCLKSQYHAALKTLRAAIEKCPDDLWAAEVRHGYWHIVYHTLFFTHLYLQQRLDDFSPWEHHREDYECLGGRPIPPHDLPTIDQPYMKDQMLAYWQVCEAMVDGQVEAMDLQRAKCGFFWYSVGKLEHQWINVRHIQHHAGQLADRLRTATEGGQSVGWVAAG